MPSVGLRTPGDLHASRTIKLGGNDMKDVDVLAEIREWRDEFARSHGYDLAAIAAAIREADGSVRDRLVPGEPRRPTVPSTPNQAERIRPVTAGSGS
jgi:hypothetical protein